MAREKSFAVGDDEIYHESCYDKQYTNDEKQPEYVEIEPNANDECDYCGGLMMEPPDPDLDDDDFEDDDIVSEDEE